MIAFYNKSVGNILMLVVADGKGKALDYERHGDLARVFCIEDNETVAWNIFHQVYDKEGQIFLSEAEINRLNNQLEESNFKERLVPETKSRFVIAKVEKREKHPDSDHLSVCQVNIGEGENVQIVCGAPNVREGIVTVAALPITLLPSGILIFEGELRGVTSYGMLCSPKELALVNAPEARGIIELDEKDPKVKLGAVFTSELWYG